MRKLFIITGAAIGGIMMAAFVFLHSPARSEDLFEENVEAFGYADPVFLPCEKVTTMEYCEYQDYIKDPESGGWKPWGPTKSLFMARNIRNDPS